MTPYITPLGKIFLQFANESLGLIIEDLHDENVLTAEDMLHFIDTVFFIKPNKFWD